MKRILEFIESLGIEASLKAFGSFIIRNIIWLLIVGVTVYVAKPTKI